MRPANGDREGSQAWMRERMRFRAAHDRVPCRRRMYKRRAEEADASDIAIRFPVYWFCWRAQCRMAYRRGT